MSPLVLFLLAILAPFGITLMLLGPLYASMFGAVYIVYAPASGPNPVLTRVDDVFYILDVYHKLLQYWLQHMSELSFVDYTLPIVALPAAGVLVSLYGTNKLIRGLLNLFRLSTNH